MFELEIPGFKTLQLKNVVLDFNGTISCDGKLLSGVSERLLELSDRFTVFVITADTFGTVHEQMKDFAQIKVLDTADHRDEKRAFVTQLGADSVVAFGNGRNDVWMLEAASLGIGICQKEGASAEIMRTADIICTDILDGLDLLRFPKRLLATLRA